MLTESLSRLQRKPEPIVTLGLFLFFTAFMAWSRLVLMDDYLVGVGYGVPLLACLWYPHRRLLWSLAAAFMMIATIKIFVVIPEPRPMVWTTQMLNMLAIAVAVHLVIDLTAKLRRQAAALEEKNRELVVREHEISHQNEELQHQTEELAQQNEEILQQAEELQAQAEELQVINAESAHRQALLQTLLNSLHAGNERDADLPERVCQLLLVLLGEDAAAAVVLEKEGNDLVVLAQAGPLELPTRRWPFDRSFAAVVMGNDRTACVPDLLLRPDLEGAQTQDRRRFRSVLATPLRLAGRATGVIKVYAREPRAWTREQFRLIEWISEQCSLSMDSRRLQVELLRSNADLDQRVRARTAELQELVNDLEHFSYTITHDLRAPLRAMHGFAALLSEECSHLLDARSREYLSRITTAASRMDRLITDALSYSRVVRHEIPLERVDLGRLLGGMVESYPIFQEPRARVRIDPALPAVMGNEAALTQCFSNLLGNAVKFVAPGVVPDVRVTATVSGGRVRVWCEDNGIGIQPELHTRVFVMFQRLSKDYEGTGIGLALVKKVVERMGGSVGLESLPGRGSRFWVELRAAG